MIRYQKISQWVKDCQSKLGNDWDAVMLFTGKEGTGKSTIMFQVLAAVDPSTEQLIANARQHAREVTCRVSLHLENGWILPHDLVQAHMAAAEAIGAAHREHRANPYEGFTADRMCMTLEEFLSKAPSQPPGAAIGVDEALILNRTGMTRHQIAFIKYLTVCRGLNHAIGIAYPHEAMADKAIKDYRVRWRWHVPRRGLVQLMEPQQRRKRNGDPYTQWVIIGQWSFKANKGPRWNAYQYKKRKHMESYNPLGAKSKEEELGVNLDAFNEIAPVLLSQAFHPSTRTRTDTPPPTPTPQS
jgi:hypothetical protein